ncbi:MAG: MFS transporter [Gemmatimonadota bacterium]|nr:MFS transporter [Gemmatimonadota bacterium]
MPAPSRSSSNTPVGKLAVLMITAFIDMVGLLMVVPLLPFYAERLGGTGLVVGLLVSSYAVAQLISAPFWGRLSDRHGRRPALLVGLGAAAVAYVIFAYASSLWLLFLSRIVQGAGGGTVSVVQAYVADATRPEDRARSLGLLSAATNLGVAIGPVLGSLSLAAVGTHAPGLAAAALCLANILFAMRYLDESRDMAEARSRPHAKGRSREAILRVVTHSAEPASRLIWIYALGMGAFQGVTAILALFLAARFGVTAKTIGYFFLYIGVISVIARAGILGRAVDRFGEARLSRLGATLLGAGLLIMPFTHRMADPHVVTTLFGGRTPTGLLALIPYAPLAIAVALLPLGTAFTFPCVTALLSRVTPSHERGLYLGVQQTFGGMARVVFPILAGWMFDHVIELPFLVSAALALSTIFLGLGMESYVKPVVVAPAPAADG